jgi:photosystem II stability/assembly factor-like uncharacterized protein
MRLIALLLCAACGSKTEDKAKPAAQSEAGKVVEPAMPKAADEAPPAPAVTEIELGKVPSVAATVQPKVDGTWKNVRKQVLDGPMPIRFTKLAFAGQNGWALTTKSGTMYETTDGGKTWSAASTPAFDHIAFVDDQHGFAQQAGVLKRTTDGGKTWEDVGPAQGKLFVVSDAELCKYSNETLDCSHDGGKSWEADAVSIGYVTDYHVGKDARWLVGRQNGGRGKSPNTLTVWRRDGKAAWHPAIVFEDSKADADSVAFIDDNTVWMTVNRQAVWTTDGGTTWKHLTGIDPIEITFFDAKNGYATVDKGGLLATTDGGMTWVPQDRGKKDHTDVEWVGQVNGTTWAAGDGGIYRRER